MTQIKKTLSIAGIIAMATMPVMADIASTAYVQSIVNSIDIPTYTAGNGIKVNNNVISIDDNIIDTSSSGIQIGKNDEGTGSIKMNGHDLMVGLNGWESEDSYVKQEYKLLNLDGKIPMERLPFGMGNRDGQVLTTVQTMEDGTLEVQWKDMDVGVGNVGQVLAAVYNGGAEYGDASREWIDPQSVGILVNSATEDPEVGSGYGLAIGANGYSADATGRGSIQLGYGTNTDYATFSVGFYDGDGMENNWKLLDGSTGLIPAERISLESILPTLPGDCKVSNGQRCALITTWNSSTNKPAYSWEVVKVNQ